MASSSWVEKGKIINEAYPDINTLDWRAALSSDRDLFANIVREVIRKSDGRNKPPPLGRRNNGSKFAQIAGEDYTLLPFSKAFGVIANGVEKSDICDRTGIKPSRVYGLLSGGVPTVSEIKSVAAAFGRSPSYFVEYRVMCIAGAVAEYLESDVDSTVVLFEKLVYGD